MKLDDIIDVYIRRVFFNEKFLATPRGIRASGYVFFDYSQRLLTIDIKNLYANEVLELPCNVINFFDSEVIEEINILAKFIYNDLSTELNQKTSLSFFDELNFRVINIARNILQEINFIKQKKYSIERIGNISNRFIH